MKLVGPGDPPPFEVLNEGSDHPVVLVCEHAGRAVPQQLGSLGLDEQALDLHIAYDIGAEALCRALAERMGSTAVLQRYSRLVIDCNRPTDAPDAMPMISDHVPIPGNRDLSMLDRQKRIDEIFQPFQNAVGGVLDREHARAAFSVHSFTPMMDGFQRPWDISFLYRKDDQTSHQLANPIRKQRPELTIGFNQPYQIDNTSDWFVPRHAEPRHLPHSLIEVRNDHLDQEAGPVDWARLINQALNVLLETL